MHASGQVDLEFGLDKDMILRIVDMGFERAQVVDALRKTEGNEQGAVDLLLQ